MDNNTGSGGIIIVCINIERSVSYSDTECVSLYLSHPSTWPNKSGWRDEHRNINLLI